MLRHLITCFLMAHLGLLFCCTDVMNFGDGIGSATLVFHGTKPTTITLSGAGAHHGTSETARTWTLDVRKKGVISLRDLGYGPCVLLLTDDKGRENRFRFYRSNNWHDDTLLFTGENEFFGVVQFFVSSRSPAESITAFRPGDATLISLGGP